jgi:hypothetical protein
MMTAGALGFYLGVDTPPHRFRGIQLGFAADARTGRLDTAELLTALGTFFAALTAFVSVTLILFGAETRLGWTVAIMLGWIAGVVMQITAGTIARIQA